LNSIFADNQSWRNTGSISATHICHAKCWRGSSGAGVCNQTSAKANLQCYWTG
jgi:hypothetical protein